MKVLSSEFSTQLSSGATTLCYCWKILRQDGVELGFTDHDQALVIDGLSFEATTGFSGTEAVAEAGLAAGSMDVLGVLSSGQIEEQDLLGGLYDNALVDLYLVDWQQPENRVQLKRMIVGEITVSGGGFRAEMRSLASLLNDTSGRNFVRHCDAELGDARCQFDLTTANYVHSGTVVSVESDQEFLVSGLETVDAGWCSLGRLTWTQGENAGSTQTVRTSGNGANARLVLRTSPPRSVSLGDAFDVIAGCDKSFETCSSKFSNTLNFRGFPFMPGNDFVLSYPVRDDGTNDGSALS